MSKKETVGTFLGATLQNDVATMRALANADYIQHNPFIPTGLEPFISLLPVLEQNGTTAENVRRRQLCVYAQHLEKRKAVWRRRNGVF
ncbi:hypothetical protein GC167_07455 [bacterium]|nr:hypothetical protein [bacterium]